jgi:hypothetical protein
MCSSGALLEYCHKKGPPKHLSGPQIVDLLDKLMPDPKRPRYFEGYGETHNWTHKCAL